jgi:hypothetical protein
MYGIVPMTTPTSVSGAVAVFLLAKRRRHRLCALLQHAHPPIGKTHEHAWCAECRSECYRIPIFLDGLVVLAGPLIGLTRLVMHHRGSGSNSSALRISAPA